MNWKKPSVNDITPTTFDKISILKHIERCGRTCYDSLAKMTEGSYARFYNMLVPDKNKEGVRYCDFHLSVLEHGSVYLHINSKEDKDMWLVDFFIHNPYSRVNIGGPEGGLERVVHDFYLEGPWYNTDYFITTNWRVLFENDEKMVKMMRIDGSIFDYIEKYMVITPDNRYAIRKTFVVETGIDITREFNRHRCLSVSESSTRYIDPTSPNHGASIPFNDFDTNGYTWLFMDAFKEAEKKYIDLRKVGFKPQIARKVLPTDTASTVVYTAFLDDWKKVMLLRSPEYGAKGVHPDAALIADLIYGNLEGLLNVPTDDIIYKANYYVV